MQGREFWQKWVCALERLGLKEAAAALLDAGGPLVLFASQLIYFGRPLFGQIGKPDDEWKALAALLENHTESRAFIAVLREEEIA